jgi:hypothetical protein
VTPVPGPQRPAPRCALPQLGAPDLSQCPIFRVRSHVGSGIRARLYCSPAGPATWTHGRGTVPRQFTLGEPYPSYRSLGAFPWQ